MNVPTPLRTWRMPAEQRVATFLVVALTVALPAVITVQLSAGPAGWCVVGACSLGFGLFGWRVVTMNASLTPDSLIVRNLGGTERLALADVRQVRFRRGTLIVTTGLATAGLATTAHATTAHATTAHATTGLATTGRRPSGFHGAAGGRYYAQFDERHALRALGTGTAYWTGRRCPADDAAQVIAAAAGLPPVRARREIIPLPFAIALFLVGAGLTGEAQKLNGSGNLTPALAGPLGYCCVILGGWVLYDHIFHRGHP